MYHKATLSTRDYYDTIGEMPIEANVYFPDAKEPKKMTAEQMFDLSGEGWYAIAHSCNLGVCDHWYSISLATWVREEFLQIIAYTNNKGDTVGYNRLAWTVLLTNDKSYRASSVWNS